MLFNSLDFAVFLPLVLIGYWLIGAGRVRWQNLFLLMASYVFYGWWSWKFLGLIFASSLVDYWVGLGLHREEAPRRRKLLLTASLTVNLGLLGFFKYYNFFIENVAEAFSFFGAPIQPSGLDLVLPVGISFYTFQTLSYSIDVYRRKMEPARDPITFFAYVSFSPSWWRDRLSGPKTSFPSSSEDEHLIDPRPRTVCTRSSWAYSRKSS